MLPDWVSNPGPLTYESGALPIALRGPAIWDQFLLMLVLSIIWEWMYDLRVYIRFNSISVISGRWTEDNERLRAKEPPPPFTVEKISSRAGHELGPARSVGQSFSH